MRWSNDRTHTIVFIFIILDINDVLLWFIVSIYKTQLKQLVCFNSHQWNTQSNARQSRATIAYNNRMQCVTASSVRWITTHSRRLCTRMIRSPSWNEKEAGSVAGFQHPGGKVILGFRYRYWFQRRGNTRGGYRRDIWVSSVVGTVLRSCVDGSWNRSGGTKHGGYGNVSEPGHLSHGISDTLEQGLGHFADRGHHTDVNWSPSSNDDKHASMKRVTTAGSKVQADHISGMLSVSWRAMMGWCTVKLCERKVPSYLYTFGQICDILNIKWCHPQITSTVT